MFEIASPCLFTEFLILIGCTSSIFMYFDWSVLLSIFLIPKFWVSHFLKMFLVHASSGGGLVLYGCSSLVAIFWVLVWTFYKYRLQVKFVLCLEIHFFVSYIILAIVYEPFWCQMHCIAVFAQLVCSSNSSGISGLNSRINKKLRNVFLSYW